MLRNIYCNPQELRSLEGVNSEIKKLQAGLTEEIEAWKEKLAHMVPRLEWMAAKNDARAVSETLEDVRWQLDAATADSRKSKELMYATRHELEVIKSAMVDMVPRREHLIVVAECKKLGEQKESVDKEKGIVADALEKARVESAALAREMVELTNTIANMVGKDELAVAKAEAKKTMYEADTLRSVQEALQTQVASLKARLANGVNREQLEAEQTITGMGWLRLVGSIKLQVSFVEYRLFHRALLHKRPIF